MKSLQTTIQEKLRLGKDTKIELYKKLIDVNVGEDLYICIKINSNNNSKIDKGKRIKLRKLNNTDEDNQITWSGETASNNSLIRTFTKNVHYDNESIIAGMKTQGLYYFISAKKEYFEPLNDPNTWKDITSKFFGYSIKNDKKLKEYIDENIKFY